MLMSRIFSAFIMLSIFLSCLFLFSGKFFASIVYIASLLALYEWSNLLNFKRHEKINFLVVSLILMYLIGNYLEDKEANFLLIVATIFWLCVAPLFLIFKLSVQNRVISFVMGWILIMPLSVALNFLYKISPWIVLLVLSVIWLADSGAYFFGKQFGRIKLAPSISPGKTWEGFVGAIIIVTLFSLVMTYCGFVRLYPSILFFNLILIFSVEGDLFESYIKRIAKVKDSSDLIPGHGGVLDRIDSLCSSLPLATIILMTPSFFGKIL
ncbi:MAG: phosphatidate cytidylyltransferase [Candidatus Methylopumilus sp.]|nr:phosphatidate cytidylyltransferase [Candidatus Methylopumilus sp.]